MEALGSRNVDVEVKGKGNKVTVTITREVPVDAPSTIKIFLSSWNKLTQIEEWSINKGKSSNAKITIDIQGVPAKISGVLKIKAIDSGCISNCDMEIKSSIPFLGRTIANFVGETTSMSIDNEFDYIGKNA